MLKFAIRTRPRKMSSTLGLGSGPLGRIERLRRVVTALMRYERLESYYGRLDEARGYAERLIHLAIKNGDTDKATMEMANYWLLEKDLVHKLFKVLAPRYRNCTTSFTQMHILPSVYPGHGGALGILELKGNPWPPVEPKKISTKKSLVNQLLDASRTDFENQFLQSVKPSNVDDLLVDVNNLMISEQENKSSNTDSLDPTEMDVQQKTA